MPSIAPSWLAGIQDPDKAVSRAAQKSFDTIFATPEKVDGVWQTYQSSMIEYLQDVALHENENTLSDERTTSPDDASAKYARTVGCALMSVNLLFGMFVV